MFIDEVPSTGHRIDVLYAWLSTDADGEGLFAIHGPDGALPLVGADLVRMEYFRAVVAEAAARTGRPVRLVKFETRTVLTEITG